MAARKKKAAAGPRVIRCSSLLYGARCPAAIAEEEDVQAKFNIPAEISNPGSRLGHAYHALQAYSQKHGYDKAIEAMPSFASEFGADQKELGWLWSRLRIDTNIEFFDEILVEQRIEVEVTPGLILSGTPDLVRVYNKGKALDAIDWKSGRLAISDDPDAYGHDQVISYVVAECFERTDIEYGRALIYPVRLGDRPTIYSMDAKMLAQETDRIFDLVIKIDAQRALAQKDRQYGVGIHCRFCNARRTCPAYRVDMESAIGFVDHAVAEGKGARAKNAARKEMIQRKVEEAVAQYPLKAFRYMRLAGELHETLKEALKHDAEFWGDVDTKDGKILGTRSYKAPATLTVDYAREQIRQVLEKRLPKKEASQIGKIIDEVCDRLSDRPLMDRQRFGHFKK